MPPFGNASSQKAVSSPSKPAVPFPGMPSRKASALRLFCIFVTVGHAGSGREQCQCRLAPIHHKGSSARSYVAQIRSFLFRFGLVGYAAVAALSHAASITQVTPQGAVNQVRQVVVQMSDDAVRLGNAQAPAPVSVQCTPEQQGSGRWNNAREWVWQLEAPMPAGTRCQLIPEKTFK